MMKSNVEKIRIFVFRIWFLTLIVIVFAFAEKLSGAVDLAPPFASVFQSGQMMIGLVVPQIGVMGAFYFNLDAQRDKIESIGKNQLEIIIALSVFYHLIFIASVIFGVVFYGFDRAADGDALERNTAAVVSIMGLFSLFIAPVAYLFARPKDANQSAQ